MKWFLQRGMIIYIIPDALSRLPVVNNCHFDDDEHEVICNVLWEQMSNIVTLEEVQESCKDDMCFKLLRKHIHLGWPKLNEVEAAVKPFYFSKDVSCVMGK